jgi:hypothetical protein
MADLYRRSDPEGWSAILWLDWRVGILYRFDVARSRKVARAGFLYLCVQRNSLLRRRGNAFQRQLHGADKNHRPRLPSCKTRAAAEQANEPASTTVPSIQSPKRGPSDP